MITNILIEVLSSVAEQERLTIRKRQKEGIDAAKRKGKHMGRPKVVYPNNFVEVYGHWKTNKLSAKQAMRTMGLSSSTFYRLVKQYEECSVSKGS